MTGPEGLWLKNLAPLFSPIRSKIETNRDSLARVRMYLTEGSLTHSVVYKHVKKNSGFKNAISDLHCYDLSDTQAVEVCFVVQPQVTGQNLDCEQPLFCSNFRGEERKKEGNLYSCRRISEQKRHCSQSSQNWSKVQVNWNICCLSLSSELCIHGFWSCVKLTFPSYLLIIEHSFVNHLNKIDVQVTSYISKLLISTKLVSQHLIVTFQLFLNT